MIERKCVNKKLKAGGIDGLSGEILKGGFLNSLIYITFIYIVLSFSNFKLTGLLGTEKELHLLSGIGYSKFSPGVTL